MTVTKAMIGKSTVKTRAQRAVGAEKTAATLIRRTPGSRKPNAVLPVSRRAGSVPLQRRAFHEAPRGPETGQDRWYRGLQLLVLWDEQLYFVYTEDKP